MLRNVSQDLRVRRVLWKNLNNGELARDVELVISVVSEVQVRTGSGSELKTCKLYLVSVQKVRWDNGGIEPADTYKCFHENGIDNHQIYNMTDEFISFLVSSLIQLVTKFDPQ
jgi:hypothetical protein